MSEADLETIRHYRRLSPMLASAGQPAPRQFTFLPPAFDCVINLARTDSPHALASEADLVRRQDLDYEHIPVDFQRPLPNDLATFFNVMQTRSSQRLFVHCALNWRASAFLYLYRVIESHCDPLQARADMLAVWRPDTIWQAFIDKMLQQYGVDRHKQHRDR